MTMPGRVLPRPQQIPVTHVANSETCASNDDAAIEITPAGTSVAAGVAEPKTPQRAGKSTDGGGKKARKDSRGDRNTPTRISAPRDRAQHMEWVIPFEQKGQIDRLRKQVKDANSQAQLLRRDNEACLQRLDDQREEVERLQVDLAVELAEKNRFATELDVAQLKLEKVKIAADLKIAQLTAQLEMDGHQMERLDGGGQMERLHAELRSVRDELEATKAENSRDKRSLRATASDLRLSKSDLEHKLADAESRLTEFTNFLPRMHGPSTCQVSKPRRHVQDPETAQFGESGRAHANSMLFEVHHLVNEWAEQHRPNAGIIIGQQLSRLYIFGSVRLDVDDQGSDIDVLVVVPQHISRMDDFFGLRSVKGGQGSQPLVRMLHQHKRVTKVVPIAEAHVPCIKLTIGGIDIDLTFANILHHMGLQVHEERAGGSSCDMVSSTASSMTSSSWNSDPSGLITDATLVALQQDRQALRSLNGVLVNSKHPPFSPCDGINGVRR